MLPIVGCIAEMDSIFAALPSAVKGQAVAQYADGSRIVIDGLFVGRGSNPFFGPARGIRWHSPERNSQGMFGKGIALYGRKLPVWADNLPKVK